MDSPPALLEHLSRAPAAPEMNRLGRIAYSHIDLIDFMIANPRASRIELAQRYGFTPMWITNIQHSDAFQAAYAARRAELVDPALEATITDRFRGLVVQSMEKLQEKLENPNVSDATVLKALELGAKGLGVGGNAAPVTPATDNLAHLANRLLDLQSNIRKGVTINGQAEQVPAAG